MVTATRPYNAREVSEHQHAKYNWRVKLMRQGFSIQEIKRLEVMHMLYVERTLNDD